MRLRAGRKKAFTLIELLLSIGIIGVLSSVVIQAINPWKQLKGATDAERRHNANQMEKAVNQYWIDQEGFPGDQSIPTGSSNAMPICRSGITDASCINLDELFPAFMTCTPYDGAETNDALTGYALYLESGRPKVLASYLGASADAGGCTPPQSPIAWWRFDETGIGTALDASGNGYHGTHTNFPSDATSTDTAPLKTANSRSLSFDGTNDYVQTTVANLKTATDFTLSLWFKASTTTGPHHILWAGNSNQNGWGNPGDADSHEMHISIGRYDQDNVLNFFYGYEATSGNFVPAVEITTPFSDTSQWHHVAVIMENAGSSPSATLYLDGVAAGSDTGTQTNRTDWNTSLRIGRPGASQRYYQGKVDDVRIFTTALTAGYIREMAAGLY